MNKYLYKARNESGTLLEGEVEARSRQEAVKFLIEKNYTPVTVENKGFLLDLQWARFFVKFKKVNLRELAVFFKQLAVVFSSGVPLFETLSTLSRQMPPGNLRSIVRIIVKDVEAGNTFSQSLSKHPEYFSRMMVAMIEAGEKGGVLAQVLEKVADYLEQEHKLQQKTYEAIRYPLMVLISLISAFVLIIIFIIPRFKNIFSAFKVELPLPTRVLLGLSNLLTHYWFLLLFILLGGSFFFKSYLNREQGRLRWDRLLLKLPVFGGLLNQLALARFFNVLAAMASSGISMVYSLEITADTADNAVIAQSILEVKNQLIAGSSLSAAMQNIPFFPGNIVHMLAAGEKSGKMEEMLERCAYYFHDESEYIIANLMAMLEPLLILSLGAMVLFLALAVFLPMWNMTRLYY